MMQDELTGLHDETDGDYDDRIVAVKQLRQIDAEWKAAQATIERYKAALVEICDLPLTNGGLGTAKAIAEAAAFLDEEETP